LSRPHLLQLKPMNERIKSLVLELYGVRRGPDVYTALCRIMRRFSRSLSAPPGFVNHTFVPDQRHSVLITYGDQFLKPGEKPLKTLHRFLRAYVKDIIPGVHVLPFFPFSSDGGFAVMDYTRVNPGLGGWRRISAMAREYIIMCDLVLNHMSAESRWFREFLRGNPRFADFFITVAPGTDFSSVARPRALPLTHPFASRSGEKLLWTTFSRDQVDLNYKNPRVLLEMIRVLLLYIRRGVRIVRLDAIAYLWKEAGTSCIHLPQVHIVVRLFRAILDSLAPWVLLITETNVPHAENISYFGDGHNQAHMVYQFSLPPLVLHSFCTEDASALTRWAQGLAFPRGSCTFFNFLASHDGIGLLPAHGLLSPEQIDGLVRATQERGGRISHKQTQKGPVPYELNISYLSAVTKPGDDPALQAQKFLASQAIMLAFRGVPGIYVHSLLGSVNYPEGVEKTRTNRAINRQKLPLRDTERQLGLEGSLRSLVYNGYARLLRARASHPAFHPMAAQQVMDADARLFVLSRESRDGRQRVICIHNVSGTAVEFTCAAERLGLAAAGDLRDIISGTVFAGLHVWKAGTLRLRIEPFRVLWLVSGSSHFEHLSRI
jgi:glycosidase